MPVWHRSALDRHEAWAADLDGDILRVGVHSLPVGDSLWLGDRNPVPDGVECPRPDGNVPGRVECPRWRRTPGSGGVRLQAERPTPCPAVLLYSESRPCH